MTWLRRDLPAGAPLAFGGDYNPEQWPEHVQAEDHALMREARVNLATVGVFAWALLEPEPGRYDLGWLDRVVDGLHAAGVGVDLATATASPPPWMAHLDPGSLPVDREGRTRWPGGRQAYCPTSPTWRGRGLALVEKLADRYAGHPALALWHVGNEYACHTARCWCDRCAQAFREWLRARYTDVDALNEAWGTAFWSQRYSSFDLVLPPRTTPDGTSPNPAQELDHRRFASDTLLSEFVAERDLLHRLSPGVPVTTNFMVMTGFDGLDYWRWAAEVDLVSTDHYLQAADPESAQELALCGDVTRGLAGGDPWLLMEMSTSAVNWQPRNTPKAPGRLRRDVVGHLARGADGACFFQWRASAAGAEKYHSGLVPHAGTGTRVWREVVELGGLLGRLGEVAGTRVEASVALVWDWQSWWGVSAGPFPSVDVAYPDMPRAVHAALWRAGVTADVVAPGARLDGYRLVVVPTAYLAHAGAAERVAGFVADGGSALVTYLSGVADASDRVLLGGYPGAYRDLLGVRVEEFWPLQAGEEVALDDGGRARTWLEDLSLAGAEAVVRYAGGPLPGVPAVTRRRAGAGTAWYVAARLDDASLARVVAAACAEAGVRPAAGADAGVEVVRRRDGSRSYLFAVNHGGSPAEVRASGVDLVGGEPVSGLLRLPGGGVAVVREG